MRRRVMMMSRSRVVEVSWPLPLWACHEMGTIVKPCRVLMLSRGIIFSLRSIVGEVDILAMTFGWRTVKVRAKSGMRMGTSV